MMKKAHKNSNDASKQKLLRRKWITFLRMCRYGVNNFTRNAWLSIAATAVMTITLMIIFTTVAARTILVDTVTQLKDRVDMSIYLKTETTDDQADEILQRLDGLDSVKSATYISASKAREQFIEAQKSDASTLLAINEANNKFPATIKVKMVDINDTSELKTFIEKNESIKDLIDPKREPSFAGTRSESIKNIAKAVQFAEQAGLALSLLFIAISSLIIFNTIRMAIFNRKEEIQMMKLIGADRSFIRGPFIVEAIVYGFIAALIATGGGMLAIYMLRGNLEASGISVQTTFNNLVIYIGPVLILMIVLGSLIGIISSLFATRKHLKS